MKIALDLDNTLFDTSAVLHAIWERRAFGEWLAHEYGSADPRLEGVLAELSAGGYKGVKPFRGAVDIVQKLYTAGHEVQFVSDRPLCDWDATQAMMGRCGLPVNVGRPGGRGTFERGYGTLDLLGGKAEKARYCREELASDLLVDDKPSTVLAAQEIGLAVLIFDRPWNQDVKGDRVTGWPGKVPAAEGWLKAHKVLG